MRRLSGFLMIAVLLAALMPSAVLAGKPVSSIDSSACTSPLFGGTPGIKITVSWENFRTYQIIVLVGNSNPISDGVILFGFEPRKTNPYTSEVVASAFSPYTYMQVFILDRKGSGPAGSVMTISDLPPCS